MEQKIREVIAVARGILHGSADPIEGCRLINEHRWDLDSDGLDSRFDPFVAFDEETSAFPSADKRHLYNPQYLSELDAQAEAYLAEALPTFLEACRELIRSYGEQVA